jgi:hypothetical protein
VRRFEKVFAFARRIGKRANKKSALFTIAAKLHLYCGRKANRGD